MGDAVVNNELGPLFEAAGPFLSLHLAAEGAEATLAALARSQVEVLLVADDPGGAGLRDGLGALLRFSGRDDR